MRLVVDREAWPTRSSFHPVSGDSGREPRPPRLQRRQHRSIAASAGSPRRRFIALVWRATQPRAGVARCASR